MASVIPFYPELPSQRAIVELGGVVYQLQLTWRQRCQGWYLDLYDVSGALLLAGRRLVPGWGPLVGLVAAGLPSGVALVVVGLSPYRRADLGGALQLIVLSSAELPPDVIGDDVALAVTT